MKKVLFVAAFAAAVVSVYACSDDDHDHGSSGTTGEHTSSFAACQAILDKCHELDVGEGPIHDCHEVAHDSESEAPCLAKKDERLKTCVADAGTSTSEAGADSAADASQDQ